MSANDLTGRARPMADAAPMLGPRRVSVLVKVDTARFLEALRAASESARRFQAALRLYDVVSPAPRPLCVDGHEYRRRTRSRRGRSRR